LLENTLVQNAADVGPYLKSLLERLKTKHPTISDVRGLGLMIGVDLAKPDALRTPDVELRNQVILRAFEKGLLLLGCGSSTIRFSPPLIVNKKECEIAVDLFDETLSELTHL
jgi:4-aminobutyrate aminotransferase